MPAATHGYCQASRVTVATAPSSPRLTTTLLTGSGEALTPRRMPPLARWLPRAVAPVPAAAATWSSPEPSPTSSAPTAAPTAGRTTVWTESHTLSTYGTLSATNSMASRMPATTRTSVRCSASGVSAAPDRPTRPVISTTA